MKVGTDGVLLGAWTPVSGCRRALDIGTGSGLIALMLAQREPILSVLGIDVDASAASQAAENFAASPWPEQLRAKHCSLQALTGDDRLLGSFDLLVSNPPYFVDSLKNPDEQRRAARHADTLRLDELMACSARLLASDGTLALILPADQEEQAVARAAGYGLIPYRITHVRTRAHKPAKRVLLAFSRQIRVLQTDEFVLTDNDNAPRSEAYQNLCKDFYLA